MNILKNKYFILGNILLLLAIIPITLYVVKRQTNLQSKASPTTNFSFSPASTTIGVNQNTKLDVIVNPGNNIVSIVEMTISVDPEKLTIISFEPNTNAFPVKLKSTDPDASGTLSISLSTSNDVQKAIQTTTKVGTLTLKGKAATGSSPSIVRFNKSASQAFSLATSDGATENVLNDTGTASVTVTGSVASNPSPVLSPQPSLGPSPTSSPSATPGQKPLCTSFSIDKEQNGIAPYSLVFTSAGNSLNSTINKVGFDFGDGILQEASSSGGIGTNAVNVQIAHTYNNPGTFTATTILTDANGKTSDVAACSKTITIANPLAATPTAALEPSPTLPITGTLETTFAILGVVTAVIGVGIFLFAL